KNFSESLAKNNPQSIMSPCKDFFIANDRFGINQSPSVFGLFGFSQKIFKFLVMPSIGINFVD
ncbi:MAG: hypothetical protein Q4G12_04160, partial [Bacteroidales bacterium]|nr:hypothetical protein [Bacteroidales bacterium]